MKKLLFLFLVLIFSSCSVSYNKLELSLTQLGNGRKIALAVLDNRPYVVNGQKHPSYVGIKKGTFENQQDIYTTSKNPLAYDIEVSIGKNLVNAGYIVDAQGDIGFSQPFDINQVIEKISSPSSEKFLIFVLDEFNFDAKVDGWLYYNVTLYVFDKDKELLVKENVQRKDNVKGNFWLPTKVLKEGIPQKAQQIFGDLLNRDSVTKALR